jgi:hypothetical protein
MVGRTTASQIASASAASFLFVLTKGLHVLGRDEPHLVAEGLQLPRPVVRARAGLDADQAGRQPGEERGDLAAPQPPAQDAAARGVGAVRLEDVLGDVEADDGGGGIRHGRLLLELDAPGHYALAGE